MKIDLGKDFRDLLRAFVDHEVRFGAPLHDLTRDDLMRRHD